MTELEPDAAARILGAALDAVSRNGEAGMRITEVASTAGVSVGTIYHHFGDREGLVRAARVTQFRGQVDADIAAFAAVLDHARDADDFWKLLLTVSRLASGPERRHNRWTRVEVLGTARARPELAAELALEQDRMTGALADVVRQAQGLGYLHDRLDPWTIAVFIQAFTLGIVLEDLDASRGLDVDRWLDVVERFMDSLRPTD